MSIRPKDPLLAVAKAIIWFFTGLFAFFCVVLALAAVAVVVLQNFVIAEMQEQGMVADGGTIGAIALLLLSALVLLGLLVWFLVHLRKIIDSVRDGDPFVPENADRLTRMGWIAVGGQLAVIPLSAMAMWLESTIGDARDKVHVNADYGFDGGGILLVIVLFILARVFRHGAAMRDDLEGTV